MTPSFSTLKNRVVSSVYKLRKHESDALFLIFANALFQLIATLSIVRFEKIIVPENLLLKLLSSIRTCIYFYWGDTFRLFSDSFSIAEPIIAFMFLLELAFPCLLIWGKETDTNTLLLEIAKQIKLFLTLPLCGFQLYALKQSIKEGEALMIAFSVLALVISACTEWIVLELGCTCLFRYCKRTSRASNPQISREVLFKKAALAYVTFRQEYTRIQAIIIVTVLLAFSLWILISTILKIVTFYDEQHEAIYCQSHIFLTCFFFLSLAQIYVDLVQQNLLVLTISSYFWFLWAFRNGLMHVKHELLIKSPFDIIKESEAVAYLRLLYHACCHMKDDANSMVIAGIVRHHISECEDLACCCRINESDHKIAINNNNGASGRRKAHHEGAHDSQQFLLGFVCMLGDYFQGKFQTADVRIAVLAFKIQILEQFPRFFCESKDLLQNERAQSQLCFSLHYHYMVHELRMCAMEQISSKYKDGEELKNSRVFNQEENIKSVNNNLIAATRNLASIFRYNSKTSCNLNYLQEQLSRTFAVVVNLQSQFEEAKKQNSMSTEILQIFLFYSLVVLNLDRNVEFIKDRLLWIYKRMGFKETNLTYFSVNLFGEKGCVLESNTDPKNIGVLVGVSKNCASIFDHPKEMLMGMEVGKLLPHCAREEHQKAITKWTSTGAADLFNCIKQSYCVTGKKALLQVLIQIQVAVIGNQLKIFVGVSLKNSADYMLINADEQIEGYGSRFQQLMLNAQFQHCRADEVFPQWNSFKRKVSDAPVVIKTEVIKSEDQKLVAQIVIFRDTTCKAEVTIVKILSIYETPVNAEGHGHRTRNQTHLISIPFSFSSQSGDQNSNKIEAYFMGDQSSTSSACTTAEFSVQKLIESFFTKAFQGQHIEYPELQKVTIFFIIFEMLLLGILVTLVYLYIMGMSSFNEVVFADGAVSDNIQLLEFLYNKIAMFYQYCGNQSELQRCHYVQRSSAAIEQLVYELLAMNIANLPLNITFLGNPYYFYELLPVKFVHLNQTIEIGFFQFMQYFIHGTKKITHIISTEGRVNLQTDLIFKILRANWPSMKNKGHQFLLAYEAVGESELKIVETYVIILTIFCIASVTVLVAAIFKFYTHKQDFDKSILFLFRLIPVKSNDSLSDFFQVLKEKLEEQSREILYDFQRLQLYPKNEQVHYSCTFTVSYTVRAMLLIFFIFAVSLLSAMAYKMVEIFPVCQNMIRDINNLMESQSYLLENYFELKVYYLNSEDEKVDNELFESDLFSSLKQDQIVFTKTALQANNVFAAHDPRFRDEFADILSANVCDLTRNFFQDWEYVKCSEQMHHMLLQQGLISTMAYFQRIVYQAVFDLKRTSRNSTSAYFKQSIFEDLDDSLIYMFRVYQATQARINEGLTRTIGSRVVILITMACSIMLTLASALCCWLLELKKKKMRLAETHGYIIMYPVDIIKGSKIVQQTLIKNLK